MLFLQTAFQTLFVTAGKPGLGLLTSVGGGITNVVLRLRQIFPDAAFAFGNRPGAGAQITIDFPYVPFFRIDG